MRRRVCVTIHVRFACPSNMTFWCYGRVIVLQPIDTQNVPPSGLWHSFPPLGTTGWVRNFVAAVASAGYFFCGCCGASDFWIRVIQSSDVVGAAAKSFSYCALSASQSRLSMQFQCEHGTGAMF